MRRIASILLAALALSVLSSFSAKADGKVIAFTDLPVEAQTFIKTHFAEVKVLQAVYDWTEYEVLFADRSKIEFDLSGNWKEIDCRKGKAVPESIIPSRILSYIKENFPSDYVCEIDRSRLGYEVKISSGFELEFDKNCNFIRIDD